MNLIKFFFITLCFSIFAQYEDLAKSAYQDIQKHGAILLDVREKSELEEEGMAKGAKSIPISQVKNEHQDWKNFLKETPKLKSIYVYCSAGGRAGKVAKILKENGYTKVINIGGLRDWKKAGLPIVKK
jgi:rhodanese-related sulfurtransferase